MSSREDARKKLGKPQVSFSRFQVWIHGRFSIMNSGRRSTNPISPTSSDNSKQSSRTIPSGEKDHESGSHPIWSPKTVDSAGSGHAGIGWGSGFGDEHSRA
jgi:hypothetical protein